MMHEKGMNKRIYNYFERWTRSEKLTKQLAEKVCKHLSFYKWVLEITTINDVKWASVQSEKCFVSKTQVHMYSMSSDDEFVMKCKRICRQTEIPQVAKLHHRKMGKKKKHSPSTYLSQLKVETE